MHTRRGLITGLAALVAAPAVIRTPELLMPVRTIAATGWVLDPVAMAAMCIRDLAPGTRGRGLSDFEANRRIKNFIFDRYGYEAGRLMPVEKADGSLWPAGGLIRPAAAFA